jgi:nucleotide-binding universal stress UspA family protein
MDVRSTVGKQEAAMRVLLAHDGSGGAEEATALVENAHWPAGSTIRVVSVLEPVYFPVSPAATELLADPRLEEASVEALEHNVTAVVERLEAADLRVEGEVLNGRAATVIADAARTFGADVLIVGSRGHGAIASLVLGSVSAELVDHAPCPVLVARGSSVDNVLLATDGSGSAAAAEETVRSWAIFEQSTVRVVSVADVPRPLHTGIAPTMLGMALDAYQRDLEQAQARHREIADRGADRLKEAGRNAEAATLSGEPAAAIVEEASRLRADLIVMGSRGQTGVARLLLGSVARNVLMGAEASVLIARPMVRNEPPREATPD